MLLCCEHSKRYQHAQSVSPLGLKYADLTAASFKFQIRPRGLFGVTHCSSARLRHTVPFDSTKWHEETSAPLLPLFQQPGSVEEETLTYYRNPLEFP